MRIAVHAHDASPSINKFLREERPETVNQNDTWRGAYSAKKCMKVVAMGPRYKHGVSWHEELSDKVASVRTHCQWAMRNCGADAQQLIYKLDNIVHHYQNVHGQCM